MKNLPEHIAASAPSTSHLPWKVPGRLMYVVSHCYPYERNDDAERAHGIAVALVAHGHSVIVLSRPGLPWDLPHFDAAGFNVHHDIDGVRYIHSPVPSTVKQEGLAYSQAAAAEMKDTFRLFKPSVVLAARGQEHALPAMLAARELNLPFFYDVTGFRDLEQTGSTIQDGDQRTYAEVETSLARAADRVFTLNLDLRDELVRRGVDSAKISIMPHGYDSTPNQLSTTEPSGIDHRTVIGYFGTFDEGAGIDDLLRASAQLRNAGTNISLLLREVNRPAGWQADSVRDRARLAALATELGISENVELTECRTPETIAAFYRAVTAMVWPRRATHAGLVPPLAPLEAAAFGKAMVMSDVPAHREMLSESGCGVDFRAGDVNHLAGRLKELLADRARCELLGRAGSSWIAKQRNWLVATQELSSDPRLGYSPMGEQVVDGFHTDDSRHIRVACIMDEFTFASYKDTCTLMQLSPEAWQGELQQFRPDILFIESAWRGKDDAWNRKISHASAELVGIIEWCNQNGVPTMFWNKEDPVHYSTFLNTAKRFDAVFTTDLSCIAAYKSDLGHDRVYVMPFGANPVEHNPVEKYPRKTSACFAGSYYVRYPERIRDLDTLLGCFVEREGVEIYDRNFGKEDENYAFPEKYQQFIRGKLPYGQIDRAYKGYRYGVNLNSVKYSASMFARRVYELMASNTFVVSNYSLGVRQLFGDLAVATDARTELHRRLNEIEENPRYADRLRLAGLRKVLSQHTYEDRFAYIRSKMLGGTALPFAPSVLVFAHVRSPEQLELVLNAFRGQSYSNKHLCLMYGYAGFQRPIGGLRRETYTAAAEVPENALPALTDGHAYVSMFDPEHYYGTNYLLDLVLATRYAPAVAIGKGCYAELAQDGTPGIQKLGEEYSVGQKAYADACLLPHVEAGRLAPSLHADTGAELLTLPVQYIDRFNFCRNNFRDSAAQIPPDEVLDIAKMHLGIDVAELFQRAERTRPNAASVSYQGRGVVFAADALQKKMNLESSPNINCSLERDTLRIDFGASTAAHHYFYFKTPSRLNTLWPDGSGKMFLETTPGLEISIVAIYHDAQKKRLGHQIFVCNWNQTCSFPPETVFITLGLRVAGGPGSANVARLILDHAQVADRFAWVPTAPMLAITPHYPRYNDYYRYAFVHRRIIAYRDSGQRADVVCFRPNGNLQMFEFENVDAVSGSSDVIDVLLASGGYRTILIHALSEELWQEVAPFADTCRIVIWLHGAEVQSWKRRMFNYEGEQQINNAKATGERRDRFWRKLFSMHHPNIHFVFVSRYFYNEVASDLNAKFLADRVHVIPNPIDVGLFRYHQKPASQRKKILSIRPYASRVYANDLAVKAVLELSQQPFFADLEFLFVGDGVLFEETVAPLRGFNNVVLRQEFISQAEIAELHRDYGIFLCPSRMDTQGVSRDEAMASGLVPVTSDVGAIAEFVGPDAGFLCGAEEYAGLAQAIGQLYLQSGLFEAMSARAAASVHESRSTAKIIEQDLRVLS